MTQRSIAFRSGSLEMSGRLLVPAEPRRVVVLCHGMPSGRPPDPADPGYDGLARMVAERGDAAFWFDFRGARGAPGDFSIGGWVQDLNAVLDVLANDRVVGGIPKVVAGSSAGGAVGIVVAAARDDLAALATLAAPAAYRLSGEGRDSWIARLRNARLIRDPGFPPDPGAWWQEWNDLAAEHHVAAVSPRPLLIAHGDADDVVPYQHAERLFAAARPPKELARIPGGGHQLRRDDRGVACLLDWLDRI